MSSRETPFILAIDQGTTSSRAFLLDEAMQIKATAQQEFSQYFPHPGWVEHDATEIFDTVLNTCKLALEKTELKAASLAGIGITNQRETVVIWEKATGKPIHNAIVWQDRRTADFCDQLKAQSLEPDIHAKTGLFLDPYFSGTKVKWILDHVEGAREKAQAGQLLAGTIDTFLIWRLTGGKAHVTDATNASRTLLFNIHDLCWDEELARLFDVPLSILPDVKNSADHFGMTDPAVLGAATPVLGVAGDQQAATIGNACFKPGMMKSTYGTGCFALLNTGARAVHSENKLLTTLAYMLDGKPTYALEGSIFMAGASVQWLRDQLKVIKTASECDDLAVKADPESGVYLVPAFTGLGAPYWDPHARASLQGLTRGSGIAEIVAATLESVAYQTYDLIEAMRTDGALDQHETTLTLRVDGGMSASNWTMQFLSDILDAEVHRPNVLETTVLGAAWLAGSQVGLYPDQQGFSQNWALEQAFSPQMEVTKRLHKIQGWQKAVSSVLN